MFFKPKQSTMFLRRKSNSCILEDMNKNILINVLCVVAGLAAGYALFSVQAPKSADMAMNMDMSSGMDMSGDMDMSGMHNHPMVAVDTTQPVPTVSVEALKDTKDGYNLHITTENFTFTPEDINGDPTQGEGHAHIYVNDVKFARLYGNWFNLPAKALKDGENEIMITLNANDHSEWAISGQHVADTVVVTK